MVLVIYAVIFSGLMYYNGFFGIFKDSVITKKQFTLLFLMKLLAVPVFYIFYNKVYGGMEKFDAGLFYHDVKAVNHFAKTDFLEYLKMMFGLQDDSIGSYVYDHCLLQTENWDNGRGKDFLYNDNRIVIRIHSVLHFIAFDSYFPHALFSCFLSFTGITLLYRSLKEFFTGKELPVLLLCCFLPALWFYTGALLKEGLTVLFLGCIIYQLKKVTYGQRGIMNLLWLAFLVFISLLLKAYLLFFSVICFTLFFMIWRSEKIKHRILVFFSVLLFSALAVNFAAIAFKNKPLVNAALERQRVFADAAKGGLFLLDSVKFVRLEYDSTLVERVKGRKLFYTIKKNSPYIYWEHTHQEDTLFCKANADTLTQLQLIYYQPESGSNLSITESSGSGAAVVASCLYYSLFYPMFFNAKSALQLLASIENIAILISLLICLGGFIMRKKNAFVPLVLLFFAVSVCFLIGLTSPNSGAIFRYRSPVVIFILLAALYYLPVPRFLNRKN